MHTNTNNNADVDSVPYDWINWCRLCAKDDEQHNINILLPNHTFSSNQNKQLRLQEALEKYFGVQTSSHDSLPKKLCTNCLSLVSVMINFSERVERVQLMFSHLAKMQNVSDFSDLNSIRLKFQVTECEREDCLNSFLLIHDDKMLNTSKLNESCRNFSNDGRLEVQIKEENVAMGYDSYLEKNADSEDKDEVVFTDNLNDSLPDDKDPFEHDEKEEKLFCNENVNEQFSQPQQSKNEFAIEKPKVDKSRKNRKRKKFKQFTSKECLQKASVIKDIKMEASCKECGNTFSKYMLYREHMQQEHKHSKSEKHWPCPACDKILLSLYNLERHVRIHVPLEIRQTFKCSDCDNRYTSNAQLETHVRYKHKNEKPFICEECGLSLRTNSNLRQHMLIHTDLAPYECDVCKKKFKNKTRLKTHMDIHSPNKHVCNICGLQLNSRATLNRHFLVHSDDMQHKCDYCGKAFKRAKALKNHLLLHTGLKPYSCDFCERTFANGSNCRSHMKKMHPEELALLEASGNKTHTRNIPKLETLKAVTKAADNLTPVVTKSSGCFAFGKKPKDKDKSGARKSEKSPNKQKNSNSLQNGNEKLTINSPSSKPLDLQNIPLVSSSTPNICLPHNKNIDSDLSSSSATPIPNFDNIYQHLLKQNQTDLQIKPSIAQLSSPPFVSDVSTPQHNPFYQDIISASIKPMSQTTGLLLRSSESHHSPAILRTHDDHSNASSIDGQFYGSMRATLPPGNFT